MKSKYYYLQVVFVSLTLPFSNNEGEEGQNENPAKKKKFEIRFRKEWKETYPWLQEDPNIKQGKKCLLCCVPIFGNLSHIFRHANTDLHKKNENIAKSTIKISNFTQQNSEENRIMHSAKDLEIRLCLFVAEHNLPFTSLDHLSQCVKTVKDSKIVSKMCLNRQKGQKIITSITGPENCKSICNAANTQYYSVIIDESTDVSMNKNLAVIIRIFTQNCRDRFLDFASVANSTSIGIFNSLMKVLKDHNISTENLLGFAADNCNVMMGKRNGVQAKLRAICPKIFINGDVCHNLNLSSEAAASMLPRDVEKLMPSINHHFCHSASRKADFF
ncbi:uncharacterized protein LOC118740947 [Rhagoletis pomonella]|uniref:uncharacterized protein LOC118740947 n=1 Tax=Rhagoletis pomonella TaxID=28610 RepID=UPI00178253B1|nr:uncharacterized protein LOC118740947 [Rhagoletis pomonella]